MNDKTEDIIVHTRRKFSCQICKRDGHETETFRSPLWCFNCKINGHSIEKCFKSSRNRIPEQVWCQLCNKQGHMAPQCFSNQECQLCRKRGHTAKDCFLNRTVVRITCQLYSKQGQSADKCFSLNKPVRPVPTELNKVLTCQICDRTGHEATKCRMMSAHKECEYCKTSGHRIEECYKKKYNEERRTGNQNQQHSNQRTPMEEFQSKLLQSI